MLRTCTLDGPWQCSALLVLCLLSACSSTMYLSTSGSHAPPSAVDRHARYVVWSNHPGVGQYITSLLLQNGHPVVERAKLEQVMAEQRLRLSHTPDAEADVLRVGRLVGATQVIFADVQGVERSSFGFASRPQSVTVRAVAVESAEVRWVGLASFPESSANPERAVLALAEWAIVRATCYGTWEEPSATQQGGCREKAEPVKPVERSIWSDLRSRELAKEYEWLHAEKRALDHEKQALNKRRAEIAADTDLQRLGPKQQVLAEYSQRLAEYEKRVAAYSQRVATYNQRQAEAAGQPR